MREDLEKKAENTKPKEEINWGKFTVIVGLISAIFYGMAEHKKIGSFIDEVILGKNPVNTYKRIPVNYRKPRFIINSSPVINNSNIVNNTNIHNNNGTVNSSNVVNNNINTNIVNNLSGYQVTDNRQNSKYPTGWYGFGFPSKYDDNFQAHNIKYIRLNTNKGNSFNDLCKSINKTCTTTIKGTFPAKSRDEGCKIKDEDYLAFCE